MATSGSVTTNTAFGYVRLAWETSSQSIANNTSTITYTLSIYRSSNISSSAAKSYSITINGAVVASGTTTIGGTGTKIIRTGSAIIPHNSDGTKTFSYSFSQEIGITWSGTYIGTVTGSSTGTLNTIPRATTPTLSASSVALGSNLTITTTGASAAFKHTLSYSIGNLSGTIQSNVVASYTWLVPKSIANAIPNTTSGSVIITCQTYNGTTLIGTKSVTVTVTVPDTTEFNPSISDVAITEAVDGIASKFSAFVQNRSKLNVAITAAGVYGSSIASYTTYIQAIPYYSASFTSGLITASGTIGVVTNVTDSRGRTTQVSNSITVLPYVSPTISVFTGYRANSLGEEDYEGQYLKIDFNFSISPVNNLNDKYYEIIYRVKGTTTWSFIESGNLYSKNASVLSGAVFNPDNAYDVAINIYDYFSGASASLDIPTAFTLVDFNESGKGIAFGKVSEADQMEIALDVNLTGELIQEARQIPTLQNSWVNYGAAYESASYWKDSCEVVHLAGLIKSGATAAETVIFQLPAGYRPRVSEKFFAVSLNAICVIDVYTNGNVAIKTGANSGWLSLSGISFRAEN